MNLKKAEKEFEIFAKQYDLNFSKMKRKYGHSYRVMQNAGKIAESLNLNKDEIELSKLIGLLHDIGHFETIKIKDGLSKQEMLFSKIIRDADKLDIYYEGKEMFWTKKEQIEEINNDVITNDIIDFFGKHILWDRNINKTKLDGVIHVLAFMFGINFKYDFEVIKKEDYINKILNKFNFKNEVTKKQIEQIRNIANEYIEKQLI